MEEPITEKIFSLEEIDYAVECAVKHYNMLKKFVRR